MSPGSITVTEGTPVVIKAEVGGELPSGARLSCGQSVYDMRFSGNAFEQEFASVDTAFDYSIHAGDAESQTFHVNVIPKTKIEKLAVSYDFPEYLKLPPRSDDPFSGSIAAVEDTQVTAEHQDKQDTGLGEYSSRFREHRLPICGSLDRWYGLEWKFSVSKSGHVPF